MAIGLSADTHYARRSSIPSGGTGTLSDGAFANCFVGVWLYRPNTVTDALSRAGGIIHFQAGARECQFGFDNAGSVLADISLSVTFNSGGGTGAVQSFTGYAGNSFLDEWIYYFFCEDGTSQHVGYIRYGDLGSSITDSISRTNDNAGSQYINTLTIGNISGSSAVVAGHYAYARAIYGAKGLSDVMAYAQSNAPITGDWGFWPLADNSDTGDDSGNAYDLTFSTGLTSETSPSIGGTGGANDALIVIRMA